MNNDELRAQDALIDRIDRALADGTGEVLTWTDDDPMPWDAYDPLPHQLDPRSQYEGDDDL